ncbi:hybrid sensor histidine kinase/response regulator [Ancylothrix sp. C2]|uniref:hybrid sensor histidine kinase/response regulator n=1 Tax=Ancylothrix sp. D3o TaxID=2953691 RepID=UPI0021BB5B5C|nr:hybrid sensor histidine kinase/response regulator [Ancylothrix sp. D3o]MCT7951779.1 hybrid sensor histidine kinase/response regulator [Ancylothrix sp. D3o]
MNQNNYNDLLGSFFAETKEFLQSIEANLLALEFDASDDGRLELVKELFRLAHSLKGSALMFGFQQLADAAHGLEDCFSIVGDGADLWGLNQEIITSLLQATDVLKIYVERLEKEGRFEDHASLVRIAEIKAQLRAEYETEEVVPVAALPNFGIIKLIFEKDLPPVLDKLEGELNTVDSQNLDKAIEVIKEIHYRLSGIAGMLNLPQFGVIANCLQNLVNQPNLTSDELKVSGLKITKNLQDAAEQVCLGKAIQVPDIDLLPIPVSFVDVDSVTLPQPPLPNPPLPISNRPTIRVDLERLTELINLVGELVINRTNLELQESQLRTEVKRIRRRILDLNQYGSQLREEYDRLAGEGIKKPVSLVLSQFDCLEMDTYTEFHSTAQEVIETTQAISQSATKIDDLAKLFESSTDRLRRITDQLRSRVMQLRVVPFGRAVDHLPRSVRNLCQSHNKEVKLVISGRDTKIDESLLDAVRDPLVHLVRNAFDHGIEPPAVRIAAGKPATGQIEVEARHQGGQTIITVTDDGRGIDPEAIRRRVIEAQLVPLDQVSTLSTAELYEFLFWAGFTTASHVGELSGRGVGLDVVRNNLRGVRGMVKVDSRPGKGTSFILKLPLMLSIADALLVHTDRNTVAVAMDSVEEILHLQPHQILRAGNQLMLRWRGEFIRLMRLQELTHYSIAHPDGPSPDPVEQDYIPVVVLASSEGILAVAVERLVGQQEIVIKPLPAPLSKPHGVVGCTILGDGRVVMILDVDDLIGQFQRQNSVVFSGLNNKAQKSFPPSHPLEVSEVPVTSPTQILVVDDSYTIRQLLALTLNRSGYRVIQAKDGQEALDLLHGNPQCRLVIADIEMPRMDGFELLRQMKSDPTLTPIPVAMLTSRSGSKHRQLAFELGACYYFTKPYSERQLLDVIGNILGKKH